MPDDVAPRAQPWHEGELALQASEQPHEAGDCLQGRRPDVDRSEYIRGALYGVAAVSL